MLRNYKFYLEDILSSIHRIREYIGNASFEDFVEDQKTIDAVIRNLEIIGEASRNIPQEVKDRYPFVEWKKITDFRNILAHEYFSADHLLKSSSGNLN